MSPGVQLLFALGDRARRLLQLVASDPLAFEGGWASARAASSSAVNPDPGRPVRLKGCGRGRDGRRLLDGFDLRDRDEVRTRLCFGRLLALDR